MNNNKYSVVIIDDIPLHIDNIIQALAYYPEVEVVGTANNKADGQLQILSAQPDLLFTDIELADTCGLEMLTNIECRIDWPMQVVFYSAYDKYLLDALRLSAFDYLLKPFTQNDFDQIMIRFFKKRKDELHLLDDLNLSKTALNLNKAVLVTATSGLLRFCENQIVYFEYSKTDRVWSLILSNDEVVTLKRHIKAENILQLSTKFIQINQFQIINHEYLSIIQGHKCILVPPFNKTFSISRTYQKNLNSFFDIL